MQDQLDNTLISTICDINPLFTFVSFLDLLSSSPPNRIVESKAITNVRRLYASCINETTIELKSVDEILSFINRELGGWPILEGSTWNHSTFNLSNLLISLHEYNKGIIYNVNTKVDLVNSSIYCIRVR